MEKESACQLDVTDLTDLARGGVRAGGGLAPPGEVCSSTMGSTADVVPLCGVMPPPEPMPLVIAVLELLPEMRAMPLLLG